MLVQSKQRPATDVVTFFQSLHTARGFLEETDTHNWGEGHFCFYHTPQGGGRGTHMVSWSL